MRRLRGETMSNIRARLRGHILTMPIAAIAAAAALPGAASGQTLSAEGLTFGQQARELDVDLAADVVYDSNVARVASDAASTRGLDRQDVLFRPRVEASIALPGDTFNFTLAGLVGADFYANNGILNRERIDLASTLGIGSQRCGVIVAGGYARGQNDLRDLAIVPGDERASAVNVQTTARIGATASCGAEVGFRPTAFVEYRNSDNSADVRSIADFESVTYGGGLTYSSPAFGQLTAFVGKSDFSFPDDRIRELLGAALEFDVMSYGLRLDRRLGARLQFNGQISYVEVDVEGLSGTQYDGLNWDAALTLRAAPRLQFSAGFLRAINATSGFTTNFAVNTGYLFSADYALTDRVRLTGQVNRQERDFRLGGIVLPNQPEEDQITQLSLRATFQRSPRLGFSAFTTYEDRDSDLALYRYSRFSAGLGASIRL